MVDYFSKKEHIPTINHKEVIWVHSGEKAEEDDDDINLFHTITKNFLRNEKDDHLAILEEILTNLRCPYLRDYSWFKYTFLPYTMQREDAHVPVWMERFIVGLPKSFLEEFYDILGIKWD